MDKDCKIINSIDIRKPEIKDVNFIYDLVSQCIQLDLNSIYSYLLVCTHFSHTSAVVVLNNKIVGFLSAYFIPYKQDTLFIWQIAIDPLMRSNGYASMMIEHIMKRENLKNIKFIEATVTPSNKASISFFKKIADSYNTKYEIKLLFSQELFASISHEEELLIHIGPI
jgi:L-2,4-diaminobutyric acid acetyltransferase